MADINRFLKVRNDLDTDKFFNWVDENFFTHNLGRQTPIPNQAMSTDINEQGKPTAIYFTSDAYRMLSNIREVDHTISAIRNSNGVDDKPIEYVCYGYKDFNGDIVIEHIDVPLFETLTALNLPNNRLKYEFLAFDPSATAKSHRVEITTRIYDHLRHTKQHPKGNEVVALFGTTKHPTADNTSNCFTMKELAEATIPYVPVKTDIISGVISITPKTIDAPLLQRDIKNISDYLTDGHIECATIYYNRNQNSGLTTPYRLRNITKAFGMNQKGKFISIRISGSYQPVENMPSYDNEHTMD